MKTKYEKEFLNKIYYTNYLKNHQSITRLPIQGVDMTKTKKTNSWTEGECAVDGAHAFVLRVSSFCGIAPLRFKRHGNGYIVSVSIPMRIYSYILITGLVSLTIFGLVCEMKLGVSPYVHMSSLMSQIISCFDIAMITVLASVGVYAAPCRMMNMIRFMNDIAAVDKRIGYQYAWRWERRLSTGVCLFMLCFIIIHVDDMCYFAYQASIINRHWDLVIHYLGFYILWFIVMLLKVQFTVTVMVLYSRFRAVKEALSVTSKILTESYRDSRLQPSPSDVVDRISSLHVELCDIVHLLQNCYSSVIVIMLIINVFHLIISPYFAILEIQMRLNNSCLTHFVVLQCALYVIHTLKLLLVVEPCHYTTAEVNAIEHLVCRMIVTAPSSGSLASRLEHLALQLMLQPICFKPKGVCTLDRPLVASIFGAVTTYLVILIQFQKY